MASYTWPPQGSGSSSGVSSLNTLTGALSLVAGTGITVTPSGSNITIAATGAGTGTVTSVSVVSANGLAGTVATATTTPAITLSTSITGILKGNGTAISAGTAGTDYVIPSGSITGTAGNITAISNSTLTTLSNLSLPANQITSPGNLSDSTSGADGITVTGGTGVLLANASIAQAAATSSQNGYLKSADWTTFNNKQASGNYITALTGDVTASGPGSVVSTLATVNSNVGSFTLSSITVNAKGLITASSSASTTGSGNVVLATSPTMTSPVVGTQTQGDNSTKAASTSYVDTAVANAVAGINPAVAVNAATVSSSDTSGFTYNNGISGVGATFTGSTNTAVTIDGFTFSALGQRLLVKNDTQSPSGAFNGVYYVTQIQTALLPPILTRALDYDQPSDINNTGAIPVINGTINNTTTWVQTAQIVTVGTTPLVFVQFSYNTAPTWTTNLTLTPNNFGTVTNPFYFTKILGKDLYCRIAFTAGTTAGSTASISLPSGFTINSSLYPTSYTFQVGEAYVPAQAITNPISWGSGYLTLFFDGSNTSNIYFGYLNSSGSIAKVNANSIASSGQQVTMDFVVTTN